MNQAQAFVGLDVHKDTIAVAVAEAGRDGEVRFWGNIPNTPDDVHRLATRFSTRYRDLVFIYEAGPCGYNIYRQLTEQKLTCEVIAPSLTPQRAGDRVKNDHRDAVALARLGRAGELTTIWVPDPLHEAVRDLVRARHAAVKDAKRARQRIQSFLLRYRETYTGKAWSQRHRTWLANRRFAHDASQIAFQGYRNSLDQTEARQAEVEREICELIPEWSLGPVVNALQALRGVGPAVASTVVAEIGDFARFENPRQLRAYVGLVPGEESTGKRKRPLGITKTGNSAVRRVLFEAAWNYRHKAKVGAYMEAHQPPGIPQAAKDIAWKAQLRLSKRYRRLLAKGKKAQVAITAVARELLGFMWAIAREIPITTSPPRPPQAKSA
jgi:transposase